MKALRVLYTKARSAALYQGGKGVYRKYMTQLPIITPPVIYINIFNPYFRISFLSSNFKKASIVETIKEKTNIEIK